MIRSMTGFGRGEEDAEGVVASAEVRSVNSRFFEATVRLPRSLAHRENDVREFLRSHVRRGKVSVSITLGHKDTADFPIKVNPSAAKSYYKLLNDLKKALKLRDKISLEHVLKFAEIFEPEVGEDLSDRDWVVAQAALQKALKDFNEVRCKEGAELEKDIRARIEVLSQTLDRIEMVSSEQMPEHRARLEQRVRELLGDLSVIDSNRLELEIALLADKVDVTEECVRFRSHNKFFLEALANEEMAGRKLNFLIQEMNREANTIGAKSTVAEIAHLVVQMKEQLEMIREQLQNIE